MATEKILIFDEQGNAKRMKVRIARFLDNEPVTAADKTNIRTTLDVDDSLSGTFTTPLSVTSASDSSFTGGGKVGINQSTPSNFNADASDLVVGDSSGNRGITVSSGDASTGNLFFGDNTSGANARGAVTYDHSTNALSFTAAGVQRWSINSTGNLVAGANLGIDFGSGVGTTISDYEFGGYNATLTPASSGTITVYSASDRLQYTRAGDLVTITGKITTTAVSSPVGDYVQLNVPFAIGNLTESAGHFSGSCVIFNAAGTMGNYSIIGIEGDSFVRIYKNTSNAASATAPDFSGNESVYVGFSYHTA